MTVVGGLIRKRRKELKLSQKDLGRRVGVDRAYISLVERGQRKWPGSIAEALARELDIPMSDLEVARFEDVMGRPPSDSELGTAPPPDRTIELTAQHLAEAAMVPALRVLERMLLHYPDDMSEAEQASARKDLGETFIGLLNVYAQHDELHRFVRESDLTRLIESTAAAYPNEFGSVLEHLNNLRRSLEEQSHDPES